MSLGFQMALILGLIIGFICGGIAGFAAAPIVRFGRRKRWVA